MQRLRDQKAEMSGHRCEFICRRSALLCVCVSVCRGRVYRDEETWQGFIKLKWMCLFTVGP